VRRRLSLVWGITAVAIPWYPDTDTLLAGFRDAVRPTGAVAEGARVVITAGWPIAHPGTTNLLHVARI
jgi:pyruvate kinase